MDIIKTILKYIPEASELEIVAERPIEHQKGPKELMRINIGDPIPPGIILGKGTVLNIRTKHKTTAGGENGREEVIG